MPGRPLRTSTISWTSRRTACLTQTDPVIRNGEMVAEYHPWYGSAATMMIPELHERLVAPGATKK